jgi:hypothetical protein
VPPVPSTVPVRGRSTNFATFFLTFTKGAVLKLDILNNVHSNSATGNNFFIELKVLRV